MESVQQAAGAFFSLDAPRSYTVEGRNAPGRQAAG